MMRINHVIGILLLVVLSVIWPPCLSEAAQSTSEEQKLSQHGDSDERVTRSVEAAIAAAEAARRAVDSMAARVDAADAAVQTAQMAIESVTTTAHEVMRNFQSTFDLIKWILTIIAAVAIVTSGYVVFEFRSVWSLENELRHGLTRLTEHENDARANFKTLSRCSAIAGQTVPALQMGKLPSERLEYVQGELQKVIEQINPKDETVKAWACLLRGYLLKRLERYREAFKMVCVATDLEPNNAVAWYNRSCYAARIREDAEVERALAEAVERLPYYKEFARDDEDFKDFWEEPWFQQLTESEHRPEN